MKLKSAIASGAAIVALAATTPAFAVTTFFTNFDSLVVAPNTFVIVQSIEGWNATAGAGIEVQNNVAGTPFSQPNLVELDSNNNSAMSRLIDPGNYQLTFRYSARPGRPATTNPIEVLLDSLSLGFAQQNGVGSGDTNWIPVLATFSVRTPTTLTFRAIGTSDSFGGYLDDIRLTGTGVPEPAAWAMMLGGFGLVGSAMRRRKPKMALA